MDKDVFTEVAGIIGAGAIFGMFLLALAVLSK